ncbi:MAG: 30S ribosomal protein S8 [Gammaproteobacteria bacterium]|nr:30S ribosomal protein S8 [Gammaproteobacteria bacterium]MDE0414371.1 30S ribosomal protein S8 [Gammaproteobacteria bacterium]
MSMQDPISDMLTRIRNAQAALHDNVSMPGSTIKESIARVLQSEGYIEGYEATGEPGPERTLTIELKYEQGEPVIRRLERASRPGLRVYRGADELPRVMGGLGVAVISTSRGVMSDRESRAAGQGGEVLCVVS